MFFSTGIDFKSSELGWLTKSALFFANVKGTVSQHLSTHFLFSKKTSDNDFAQCFNFAHIIEEIACPRVNDEDTV